MESHKEVMVAAKKEAVTKFVFNQTIQCDIPLEDYVSKENTLLAFTILLILCGGMEVTEAQAERLDVDLIEKYNQTTEKITRLSNTLKSWKW
jgi:hypothetical protein